MPEKAGGDKYACSAAAVPAAVGARLTSMMSGCREGPVVHEGKAKIHNTGNDVFYNEAQVTPQQLNHSSVQEVTRSAAAHTPNTLLQVTNRDLSIAVLRSFLPIMAKEVADGSLKKQRFKQKHAEAAAAAAAASSSGKQQVSPLHPLHPASVTAG